MTIIDLRLSLSLFAKATLRLHYRNRETSTLLIHFAAHLHLPIYNVRPLLFNAQK